MALQHLRSSTADKRPTPSAMADGQLAVNTNSASPGLFFKDNTGDLIKVGPVHVGTTAPNAVPASGGEAGNALGEQWLDTTGGTYVFKVWDGSAWRSEAGEFVNITGDTMTGALVMDNQQQIRFRETTANGSNYVALQAPAALAGDVTYTLPDADGTSGQVLSTDGAGALSWTSSAGSGDKIEEGNTSAEVIDTGSDGRFVVTTEGTERLRVTDTGLVGIGTSVPDGPLHVMRASAGTVTANGNADELVIENNSAGGISILTPDANHGYLIFGSPSDNEGAIIRYRQSDGIYSIGTEAAGGSIQLRSGNGTTALTIDASQRVGIGTQSPAYQLQLQTDSAGKPSTNTWTIVSDERIKEEIELADLDLCYEAVKNIPLKRFKWKDEVYTEEQAYDRRKLGWIAQDVEAVFPKAVRQHEFKYNQIFEEVVIPAVPAELDDNGNIITEEQPERIEKGEMISEEVIEDCRDLNSDQLYAAMYGTIQKLISKVETLEAEVAALKD